MKKTAIILHLDQSVCEKCTELLNNDNQLNYNQIFKVNDTNNSDRLVKWWYQESSLEENYKQITIESIEKICSQNSINIMHFQGNQVGKVKPALNAIIDSDVEFIKIFEKI